MKEDGETRKCVWCEEEKPLKDFPRKALYSGASSRCRTCARGGCRDTGEMVIINETFREIESDFLDVEAKPGGSKEEG